MTMKTYAVMEDGVVVNIIVGVEPEVVAANPELYVEYNDTKPAGMGHTYNKEGDVFVSPDQLSTQLLIGNFTDTLP